MPLFAHRLATPFEPEIKLPGRYDELRCCWVDEHGTPLVDDLASLGTRGERDRPKHLLATVTKAERDRDDPMMHFVTKPGGERAKDATSGDSVSTPLQL